MSPKKIKLNNFNIRSNYLNATSNQSSKDRSKLFNKIFVNSTKRKSDDSHFLKPVSPIKVPNFQEKKRRPIKCLQKDSFPNTLKRKSFDKQTEKNHSDFHISSIRKLLPKLNNYMIGELHYDVISSDNVKIKKMQEYEENNSNNFLARDVDLCVSNLQISNSKELVENDNIVEEPSTSQMSCKNTLSSCYTTRNQEISPSKTNNYNNDECAEKFVTNIVEGDENKVGNREGSIIEVLSPVKINNVPCLFNIESVNNDGNNIKCEENINLYMSREKYSKISDINSINFEISQFEKINEYENNSQKSNVENDMSYYDNNEDHINFDWKSNGKVKNDIIFKSSQFHCTNKDIVPETQFSQYTNQYFPSPAKNMRCFFDPPTQIFNENQNQLATNLKNHHIFGSRKRGRPNNRLKVTPHGKWSWLHDSFTDYLNKNYCEIQRQMHDMIVNINLLKFEISLVASFPIWGVVFFKQCKYNIEENIAVICSTLNISNIKMDREYIFKIHPQYNFVVYSPYEKVIINPVMNVL